MGSIISVKFMYYIKFASLVSFFTFSLSYLMLAYSTNLNYYLQNTFLETFNLLLNNSFFTWGLLLVKWISVFIIVGCLISLILIAYYDLHKGIKLQ